MMIVRPLLRQGLAILLACIVIGTLLGLVNSYLSAKQEYRIVSQIIGAAHHVSPQLEDELMQALKKNSSEYAATGSDILHRYGYTPEVFARQDTIELAGVSILLMLIPGAALYGYSFYHLKQKQRRINELTAYLEQVNQGQDKLLTQQEDDFSHLEDELRKTVTELRQTRENALQDRRALANNLADISHQLNTPITSMSLMTQLLADSREGEDSQYIDNLSRQLIRLEALVSSLLILSRLDAGALEFKQEQVDVYAMLLRAAEPLEDTLRQKQLQLDIEGENGIYFIGDAAWTAEAFLNVLKNCSEYTTDGGHIFIRFAQNPLYIEITIEDSGKGFAREELPHLFDRFYKGRNAAKDSAGIGLAISRSIIEKQNGIIRADNAPSGGAKFTVKFYPTCH